MKKWIALLLTAVLCLSISACGTPLSAASGNELSREDFTGNEETSSADTESSTENSTGSETESDTEEEIWQPITFFVSINPQICIYLDEEFRITSVEHLNEDAKDAFFELELTGLPLADGMDVLLEAAYNKNYLQEGSVLTVVCENYNSDAESLTVQDEIEQAVKRIEKSKSIVLEYVYESSSSGDISSDQSSSDLKKGNSPNIDENQFKVVEKNEYGWITKLVQENAEGRDIISIYRYNDEGLIQENTITQYDSLGTLVECTYQYYYDGNGNVISKKGFYQDGTTKELIYQGGELVEKTTYSASNGYTTIETFVSGVLASSKTTAPDGFYSDWYYDANGKPTEHFGLTQSGNPIHTIYNPDGSSTSTITQPDGAVVIQCCDANGNLVS